MTKKAELMQLVDQLTQDIDRKKESENLATLDHLLKKRQTVLEQIFDDYRSDLDQNDIAKLEVILEQSRELSKVMEEKHKQKGDDMIHNKKKGKRIRIYTNIAKH